ncbi:MOSC N-terminal beta barrel domain-containing protein [Bradyrhizobium sp. 61]|uniref:MOSC domain-containing protein n=1 Tax=unclassified Bradyrhizobium TaxID=2631580 RepID=UPI0031F8CE48
MTAQMQIRDIWLYPVKGLRGQSVLEANVEPWGLADDRRWMIVDAKGSFVTQRTLPRMATISASVSFGGLILSALDGSSLVLSTPEPPAGRADVVIWNDRAPALIAGREENAWLSNILGGDYRFAYMDSPCTARQVDPGFGAAADRVSFADDFPLLLINKSSLDDLNTRLEHPVDLTRFRANVVVEHARAWAEDHWQQLELGGVRFRVAKACSRCAVITIDQERGLKTGDHEPLRTLSRFRRNTRGETIFGQYLIPDDRGRIKVGDPVRLAQ